MGQRYSRQSVYGLYALTLGWPVPKNSCSFLVTSELMKHGSMDATANKARNIEQNLCAGYKSQIQAHRRGQSRWNDYSSSKNFYKA
jgi:hypothetical protein